MPAAILLAASEQTVLLRCVSVCLSSSLITPISRADCYGNSISVLKSRIGDPLYFIAPLLYFPHSKWEFALLSLFISPLRDSREDVVLLSVVPTKVHDA